MTDAAALTVSFAADDVEQLCHWRGGMQHDAYHYGSPCPYHVAAEFLRGNADPRDLVSVWHVDVSNVLNAKGGVPLSLNDRMHWAAKASAVAAVKSRTRRALIDADIPPLGHAHVELHYRPKTNRFRDIDNIVATLKPMLDAMHQSEPSLSDWRPILLGDDPRYVSWAPPVLHAWTKGSAPALWLIISSNG